MMQTTALNRVTPFTGTQLRVQRPAARRPAARFVARNASGEGGSKGEGRESTMGQNQQAQNDVEQMAAPEGDRVLEGEKAQLSGSAMGAKEYEKKESPKGSDATTPAGKSSGGGVANDKSESAKGTH